MRADAASSGTTSWNGPWNAACGASKTFRSYRQARPCAEHHRRRLRSQIKTDRAGTCSAPTTARQWSSTPDTAASATAKASSSTNCGARTITAVDIHWLRTPRPRLGHGDVEREVEDRSPRRCQLRNIREAICAPIRLRQPRSEGDGNAGSFFKNPVVDECVSSSCRPSSGPTCRFTSGGMRRQGGLAADGSSTRPG